MSLLPLGDPSHITVKGRKCGSFYVYISLFSDLSNLFRQDVKLTKHFKSQINSGTAPVCISVICVG